MLKRRRNSVSSIERKVALCYVRQSVTQRNDDMKSPERQRAILQSYCERHGWIPEWFEDASGHKSATKEDNRPAWLALKERMTCDDVAAIVVYDQSRAMRKAWRILKMFEELPDYGVQLHLAALDKAIDITTSEGRMSAALQAIFDEQYADDVSRRAKSEIQYRKSRGQTIGIPPYGTIRDKKDNGRLVPRTDGVWLMPDGSFEAGEDAANPPHSEALWRSHYECAKRMLELYAKNLNGYNMIAEKMTEEGWRFRDRYGTPRLLSGDDIRRVTSNWREYAGLISDGRAKERIANELESPSSQLYDTGRSVFPLELLQAVAETQEKRSVTTRPPGAVKKAYIFPLHRLVFCAHCEALAESQKNAKLRSRLMGWNQKGRLRYRHAEGVKCGCQTRTVQMDELESQFIELVEMLVESDEAIPLLTEIAIQSEQGELGKDTSAEDLEAQKKTAIAKLRRKLDANRHLYSDGERTKEEFERIRRHTEHEIAHWENRTTETQKKAIELIKCIQAFNRLKTTWNGSINEEKQQLAQGLFEKVIYDLDAKEIVGFRLHPWADSYLKVKAELLARKRGEQKTVQVSSYVPFDDPNGRKSQNSVLGSLDIATAYITKVLRENLRQQKPLTVPQRNELIKTYYQEGQGISDIARRFNLSPQRVHQIVNEKLNESQKGA